MANSVLIVDDEEDTLKLLKMIVELSGYEAFTTLNSMNALTIAKVEQPDVILLDIMMPKMDGFQLCKMIRADPKTQHLPVIFVTAYSALDLEDRRVESGADMVLPKPVGMEQLADAIERVQAMERTIPKDIQEASADFTYMKKPVGLREAIQKARQGQSNSSSKPTEDKPSQKAEKNKKADPKDTSEEQTE